MRVRITMPTKDGKRLKEQIVVTADTIEEDEFGSDEWEIVSTEFQFRFLSLGGLVNATARAVI